MTLQDTLSQFLSNLFGTVKSFSVIDLIDVLAVSLIIYYVLQLVRETRAIQLVKSVAVVFIVYFIADLPQNLQLNLQENFTLTTLKFLLDKVLDSGLIVLVVLFQPELRRALEQIGRSKISDIGLFQGGTASGEADLRELIDILCDSCERLSESRTGTLMVLERETKLGDIINTGTVIDAKPSGELIGNLFFVNSPLHDGAMIIRDARLYAAGCFLPLSDNRDIAHELGTRHRAALGMSEVSDAIVIVVSEETGLISVAYDSRIQRGLSVQNLRKLLTMKLIGNAIPTKLRRFGREKKSGK